MKRWSRSFGLWVLGIKAQNFLTKRSNSHTRTEGACVGHVFHLSLLCRFVQAANSSMHSEKSSHKTRNLFWSGTRQTSANPFSGKPILPEAMNGEYPSNWACAGRQTNSRPTGNSSAASHSGLPICTISSCKFYACGNIDGPRTF